MKKRWLAYLIDLLLILYMLQVLMATNPTWNVYTRYYLSLLQWHAQRLTRRALIYANASNAIREAMQVRGIFRYTKDDS